MLIKIEKVDLKIDQEIYIKLFLLFFLLMVSFQL